MTTRFYEVQSANKYRDNWVVKLEGLKEKFRYPMSEYPERPKVGDLIALPDDEGGQSKQVERYATKTAKTDA